MVCTYTSSTGKVVRRCAFCKLIKGANDFPKNVGAAHGISSYCIECSSEKRRLRSLTLRERHRQYIRDAKRRGHEFTLTPEEFAKWWNTPCHYCKSPIVGVGLDRVNSKRGYTIDNLVPCCQKCNLIKAARPQKKFISDCKDFASYVRSCLAIADNFPD